MAVVMQTVIDVTAIVTLFGIGPFILNKLVSKTAERVFLCDLLGFGTNWIETVYIRAPGCETGLAVIRGLLATGTGGL